MDRDNFTFVFVHLSHDSCLFSYHRHIYLASGQIEPLFGIYNFKFMQNSTSLLKPSITVSLRNGGLS